MNIIRQRIPILIVVMLVVAAFIQGCGGGQTTRISTVHGTVADVNRNVIVDADVWIGDHHATSLASGAFRMSDVPSGWQTIYARAVVDGEEWWGSTAVEVLENQPTMNANIVLAPVSDLTSIQGEVWDDTGHRVAGARVLITTRVLLPSGSSDQDGAYGSIVAITDDRGAYYMPDVPKGISAVITASKVAYDNDEVEIPNITDGMEVDFELTPSIQARPNAPTLTAVESWTMPNPLVRSFSAKGAPEGNPYDAVKASISKRFRESLVTRRIAPVQTSTVRSASTGSLIEIDLYWNALETNLSRYLAGYGIYRRTDLRDLSLAIDFVRDPYANFYGDMGGEIQPGVSYYYRVSAVNVEFLDSWNNPIDNAVSPKSGELGVTPLGSLQASLPTNGASTSGDPLFSWQPLSRATDYLVYVYSRFPSVPIGPGETDPSYGTAPVWESGWVSGTSTRYDGPPALLAPGTYYWIVTAADVTGTAYSYSEIRSFTVR